MLLLSPSACLRRESSKPRRFFLPETLTHSSPKIKPKTLFTLQHASLAAEPAAEAGHSTAAGTNAEAYARLASNPATKHVTWPKFLNAPLSEVDPVLVDIIEHEKNRQWKGLELIPSENFVSSSVMEAVGSVMTNKYSEGYPGESFLFFFVRLFPLLRSARPWRHRRRAGLCQGRGVPRAGLLESLLRATPTSDASDCRRRCLGLCGEPSPPLLLFARAASEAQVAPQTLRGPPSARRSLEEVGEDSEVKEVKNTHFSSSSFPPQKTLLLSFQY